MATMLQKLVIIDTEQGFIHRFAQKLDDEDLTERYAVHQIVPNTTVDRQQMIEGCVTEVVKIIEHESVAVIFIDIIIIETGPDLDTSGIAIAKAIRLREPTVPICFVTGRSTNEMERTALSEASLQDAEGVLVKSYLVGDHFSARRLRTILERSRAKRRGGMATATPATPRDSAAVVLAKNAFSEQHLDARVRRQVQELGGDTFWELLGRLMSDVDSGTLEYMRPGRSGAYVFKVVAKHRVAEGLIGHEKTWVIKISDKQNELKSEVGQYHELDRTGLPKKHFPRLLSDPVWVGEIGGFVVELQTNAVAVATFLATGQRNVRDARGIGESLVAALDALHGESHSRVAHLWRQAYGIEPTLRDAVLSFLTDHEGIIKPYVGDTSYDAVRQFVMTNGELHTWLYEYRGSIKEVLAHGDLNAGNVLVTNNGQVVLIDFASTGRRHLAADFAKFERDLFFRIRDYGTADYYGWLPQGAGARAVHGDISSERDEAKVLNEISKALRTHILDKRQGVPEAEYYMALLSYSIRALANESLPVPRRVSGVELIAAVLDEINVLTPQV